MIIGWNDRILPLVGELCKANSSNGGDVIVVMAPKKKPWMDGVFTDQIEDWMGSKIVTRKGDPINPSNLMKASVVKARSIVVLSQGSDADEADAQAARCILALTGGLAKFLKPPIGYDPHIVIELRDIDNVPVVRMGLSDDMSTLDKKRKVLPLVGNDLIGRLMIQCSLEAGLAHVFSHLLEFDYNEFYFSDGQAWMDQLYGQTFAKIAFLFSDCVVVGIKKAVAMEDEMGQPTTIILNPLGTDVLEQGDSLLVIADDDDSYHPDGLNASESGHMVMSGPGPDIEAPPEPPVKVMLIGWRRDIQDMVTELDKWVEAGSQLTMLNNGISEEDARAELEFNHVNVGDLEHLTVTFEQQNPIFRRELERCNIPEFDSILVLTEELGKDGLSSDSRSMITMLLCRDLQKEAVRSNGATTWGTKKPSTEACIIAEILDPRTAELIKLANTDDHVVSNALISMALGQISEQADVGLLLDDLFSAEGNEIHIKDANLYTFPGETLSFWGILNRARQRGEVAIGWQRKEDADLFPKGLNINPENKGVDYIWNVGDRIIVLSED